MKRVYILRLGWLIILLLAINSRDIYALITRPPDDSSNSPLDYPLLTISNTSSPSLPQSWIALQGRMKMTGTPQTASTNRIQTNSNLQPSTPRTTTGTTTAERRPTLLTPPTPKPSTRTNHPTSQLPLETLDFGENDGTTTTHDSTTTSKGRKELEPESTPLEYAPFTEGSRTGSAEFWCQVAAAHYVYCGHACNSSGLVRPRRLMVRGCKPCHCDFACQLYRDCCPDMYARAGYITLGTSSSLGVRCTEASFGSSTRDETSDRYVMVTRCPSDENEVGGDDDDKAELKQSCETNSTSHWNLTQPVTDKNTFITYKNRYCAQCYFRPGAAAARNMAPWEPRVVIRDPAYVTGVISSANLYKAVLSDPVNTVAYRVPDFLNKHVRKCKPSRTVVDRCNVTGRWERYDLRVETACRLVAAPVLFNGWMHKNSFCILCNERISWAKLLSFISNVIQAYQPSVLLLILLDFEDNDDSNADHDDRAAGLTLEQTAKTQCPSDQFLDTRTSSCRQVTCSFGKAAQKQDDTIACRSSPRSTNLYGYKVCLQDSKNNISNSTAMRDQLRTALSSLNPRSFVQNSFPGLDQDLLYSQGDVHRVLLLDRKGQRTEGEEGHSVTGFANLYVFTMFFEEPTDRDSADRSILTNLDDLLRRLGKALSTITTTTINYNNDDDDDSMRLRLAPTCDPSTFRALVTSTATEEDAAAESDRFEVPPLVFTGSALNYVATTAVYLPLANSLTCPFVELAWSDFNYDPATSEIIVGNGRESSSLVASTLHRIGLPNFFIVDSNRTLVCVDEYRKVNWSEHAEAKSIALDKAKSKIKDGIGNNIIDPLYWVSLISTAVSLVFLSISFVTYCLVSSLRTVAGINNLVFIFALFSAQLFLQVAADVPLVDWLCQAVGAATHFCWLAVVFAQNACTYHMFYTLSFPILSRAAMCSPSLMTLKYTTYVISASTAFVGATLCWQLAAEGRSGYGGSACYIVDSGVRIGMFAVPLAVTVVFNVAMFLFTIARLRAVQNVESTRSRRTGLILYTKLSVFTGLTWLLGFLASLLDSVVLAYLFAVFQGCQGLFVFLAFLANRRVMELVKALLTGKDGEQRSGKGHSGKVAGSAGAASHTVIR